MHVHANMRRRGRLASRATVRLARKEDQVRRTLVAAVAAVAAVTLLAAPAWAAPVAIQVSPKSVVAGGTVRLSGSVGPDCSGAVTLISKAFAHTHDFAGLPAVIATAGPGGTFATATRIPRSKVPGTYTITGRCGGGNLGVSATLRVRGPAAGSSSLSFTGASTAPETAVGLGLLGIGVLILYAARPARGIRLAAAARATRRSDAREPVGY